MPTAISSFVAYDAAGTASTTHDVTVTVPSGADRVLAVGVSMDVATTVTGVTFDPAGNNLAFTQQAAETHSAATALKAYGYTLAVPSGVGASTYTVRVTLAASQADVSFGCWSLTDASFSAASNNEASNAVNTVSTTVSCVASGAVVAVFGNASAAVTWTSTAGVTERTEQNETNYTSMFADALTTAVESRTISGTCDAVSGNKVMVTMSFAPVSGGSAATFRPYYITG